MDIWGIFCVRLIRWMDGWMDGVGKQGGFERVLDKFLICLVNGFWVFYIYIYCAD